MKFRTPMLVGLSLTVTLLCVSGLAFAQAPAPVPAPVVSLTPQTAIVAILALVAGFIGQAINSGNLFGIVTTPKAWIPYLTLVGSFIGAFGLSIQGDTTLNETAWFNAVMAGFMALLSAAGGSAAHSHFTSHKNFQKRGPAAPASNGGTAAAPPAAPPAPPAAKMIRALAPATIVLAVCICIGGTVTTQTACNTPPANIVPAVFTVEQIACMVDGMASGLLTGTAQTIATDIQTACQIAPTLTQDIVNFIQAFQNLTPTQQQDFQRWAQTNKAAKPSTTPAPATSH
jgi:hypothetical protein